MLVLAACLLAQAVAGSLLSRAHGFWSPDSALRFIQVERFIASGYRDISIPYPAGPLDPEGRYFPLGGWFHFERGGRFYVSYLPYFSILSAPFFRLFGFCGLFLIPAAAALATVWISYEAVRAHTPELAWAAAGVLGLGTPLLIYGAVFWDHTLAVALAAGALVLLGRSMKNEATAPRSTVTAGLLLGLALWLRNEMYPFAAATGIACWLASPRARAGRVGLLLAGALGPAAALWAVNTRLFGSPVGWKGRDLVTTRLGGVAGAAAHGMPAAAAWVADKLGNAYYQLASPDFYAFNAAAVAEGLALTAALVLGAALAVAGSRRRARGLILAGTGILAGATVSLAAQRTVVSGLLPAAPVVLLAVAADPRRPWERFLWTVVVLFSLAVIVTATHGGAQWGPRYILPALPPLIWLAARGAGRLRSEAADCWPTLRNGLAVTAAAGILLQCAGIDQVLQATERNARLNAWLSRAPADLVVTPLQWLTVGSGPVYFERRLLLVQRPDDLRALVETLAQQRVARWAYIPFSALTFAPVTVAGWTSADAWRFRPIQDGFFEGMRIVTYGGSPASP